MRVSEPYTLFRRELKSGKVVYYYQFRTPDGRRSVAKSTGCTTEASAKRFCNKLYNAGEFLKQDSKRFGLYANDFFSKDSEWYQWKKVNQSDITEETLDAYNKWLRNQVLPFFENYHLHSITRAVVKEWIIWANSKWSPKTVNNGQTVLNIILKSAVEKGIIDFNPAQNLGFRKVGKKVRNIFTIEELQQMYKSDRWSKECYRQAFLLDCITGMRISEIAGLKITDIHDDYILVAHTYSRKHGLGETTKGKETRIVPIPKDFVFPQPNEEGWLYYNEKNKPFDISTMNRNIINVCSEIGIDTKERCLSTHCLRDFYNTFLEAENITDAKVKAVIGHKDVTMTGHYTYWKPDMFQEVHSVQDKLYKQILGVKNGSSKG